MSGIVAGVIFFAVVVVAVLYIRRRDSKDVSSGETSLESNRPKGPTQFPK